MQTERNTTLPLNNMTANDLSRPPLCRNNLSVDLLASDGLEVTNYIRKRLGHEKIIISGSSWGSFLATKMAHSAPNKYHFYVGLSQIVNGRKLYTESYKKVKSIAIEKNDQATLNILNSIGPPFWSQPASFGKLRRTIKKYEDESVSQLADWKMANEYLSEQTKRAYIFGEEFSFLKYIGLNGDGMVHNIALDKCCNQFKIPIYIIQGQKDLLTVPRVTREYFKKIKAPVKEYIPLEHSAHDQTIEMLQAYLDTLNAGVSRFIEKAILPAPKTSN